MADQELTVPDLRGETGEGGVVGRLYAALDNGLRDDPALRDRLRHAATSVGFAVTGEGRTVTLLLDRAHPEVRIDEPAEITLELDPELAVAFADGRLPMPGAVASGDVRASGPVRRYLEVDPIVRRLLSGAAGTDGHDAVRHTPLHAGARVDPDLLAIETRELHKAFGANHVLNGLNIRIPAGVISVVLGPSGTGKSVLLQHIIGLLRPDAGEVLIRGRPLSQMRRTELLDLRSEIGVMFQDGALFSAMNVYDNVAFPLRQHTDLSDDEVREVVSEHLQSVGLGDAATRMPNQLSGGMRKRAGLARALVMQPGIVLCDEPDSGLDPVRTALLGDLLVEQHARYGGTMLVVTHNVMLARLLADHVSLVWRGEVLEAGLAEDVFASQTPFVRQFLAGEVAGPLGMDA
jgi:phospholipid/cholesterol/gamma-HCH transport system ATP-binding protein